MDDQEYENLLFRRQYFIGPEELGISGWNLTLLPDGKILSARPELEVTDWNGKHTRYVLIGYIFDPFHPERTNQDILEAIDRSRTDVGSIFEMLEDKSGHYVLFVYDEEMNIALTDACGIKQISYYCDENGKSYYSSQPALIAQKLNLLVSDEAIHYMDSAKYKKKLEPWWPVESSPYKGIRRLVPNHYLNLATNEQVRFWPNKKLKRYSLKEGTILAGELLKGICKACFQRYPIALTFTGGYDSRVLLAACKEFADQIELFSMIYRNLTEQSEDLRIPQIIATEKQLKYHQIKCDAEIPAGFQNIYERSNQGYKTDWMSLVYGRYVYFPADVLIVKGNIAEVARCSFWQDGIYPIEVTVDTLVDATALGHEPLILQSMGKWLDEAKPTEKFGYKIMDIFAWEVEAGGWQSMSHNVFALSQEEFSPFGNRRLLDIMLGVHKRYRCWPDITLEQEIIKYLWRELSEYPYFSSWNLHNYKKKFYDGDLLNFLRKIKYRLKRSIK